MSQHGDKPILHIDIHGKMNKKAHCNLDVGTLPME